MSSSRGSGTGVAALGIRGDYVVTPPGGPCRAGCFLLTLSQKARPAGQIAPTQSAPREDRFRFLGEKLPVEKKNRGKTKKANREKMLIVEERFAHDERTFMNKRGKTRKERHASRDKESKEKALLEQRPPVRGQKYINYGRGIASAAEGTVAHISEQDRFFTDFAAEEKKRRELAILTKQEQLDRKRYEWASAEENRWKQIEQEYAAEEAKQAIKMNRGAPRNMSSVPYNPLTLQYEESEAGDKLRYTDDQIRFRAALRAERLRSHETKHGFNPITGQETERINLPPEPKWPN